MSATLATVRGMVRAELRDNDPQNYALDSIEMNRLIEKNTRLLALDVDLGLAWAQAALTFVAGTDLYQLSGIQYAQLVRVWLDSRNTEIQIVTPEVIDAAREGQGTSSGFPDMIAFWEDESQKLNARVFPTPNVAGTGSIFRAVLPAALSTDATAVPFSDPGLELLATSTALEAASKLPDSVLAARNLNARVFALWQQQIEKGKRGELIRRAEQRNVQRVRRVYR